MEELTSFMESMMLSEEGTDATFLCRGKEFRVHKLIVCRRSPVVAAAFKPGFSESESNTINMDVFEPEAVRRMIQYMYKFNYDDFETEEDEKPIDEEPLDEEKMPAEDPTYEELMAVEEPIDEEIMPVEERKGDEQEVEMQKDEESSKRINKLEMHVEVSAIGNFYQVAGLSLDANEKVQSTINAVKNKKTLFRDLPDAISRAVEISGEEKLLELLAHTVAGNLGAIRDAGALEERLFPSAEFSFRVLEQCSSLAQIHNDKVGESPESIYSYGNVWRPPHEKIWLLQVERENRDLRQENSRLQVLLKSYGIRSGRV